MPTQPSETKYLAEKITRELTGATIIGPIRSAEDPPKSFGFEAEKPDGTRVLCWLDQDAEGNGPGWISIELKRPAVPSWTSKAAPRGRSEHTRRTQPHWRADGGP